MLYCRVKGGGGGFDPYTYLSEYGYNLASLGTMLEDVYYDPLHEAAFGTLEK